MAKARENLPDFEQALAELEELVTKLESGDLTLDESLDGFKKGIELTKHCQDVLNKAQQTVEQLLSVEDEATAQPFDADSDA